jgi:hypothetical protein
VLLPHHGQYSPGDVHGAEQQCLDLAAHLVVGQFLKEASVEVTGVVHQNLDATKP